MAGVPAICHLPPGLMNQTAHLSKRDGRRSVHRGAGWRRDIGIAAALVVALMCAIAGRGQGESYVVSLADADTAVVVSLAGAAPKGIAVIPREATPPAASSVPTQIAATLLPAIDFPPKAESRMTGARTASRALASFVGIASTYNPFRERPDAATAATASGEAYDETAWTAAIQIDLRRDFGGVRYGRLYRPTFALVERGDKRAIVRINDVGPLRPGRVIDLNERSMLYFDPSLRLGLVRDVKVTLLAGDDWMAGPLDAAAKIDLASAM